ncbi:hypothetical protein BD779DRAFT_1613786 [Infundibulicybe gibba]|nr:hypothetical protein BD779DRAFT_1613786 [Infundibulicybe gibba]
MKRRGNKSNKVPNVRLRPAQEGAARAAAASQFTSTCWAQDSQLGSDDTNIVDLCPRPFKGVVVCATGVADKPTLFKQALELGAVSVSAFTDRVTHLIAADHGGCQCALERGVPILKPSWVSESYQVWLRGDDVDLGESIQAHRLPIFSDVILCPSGINDITRRTQISKLLTLHQGVYMKNLERPIKVTHLLCSGEEETDKMGYAEKFNSRGEAKIHLVWEEWFWDSLEFGGRFDEEKYQVRRPRPERKSLHEAATSPPASPTTETHEGHDLLPAVEPIIPSKEPFVDEEEELASVRRVPAVTLQLWGSLLQKRGYEVTESGVVSSTPAAARKPLPNPSPVQNEKAEGGSVISSFRRANSFAPVATSSAPRQPFRRTATATQLRNPAPLPRENTMSDSSFMASAAPMVKNGIRFRALGEAKSASVREAIEQSGGVMVVDGDEDEVDYIIVRLVSGSKLYRMEIDKTQQLKYRTECWLERCIFRDKICPTEEHASFAPLKIETPIPGADEIVLSFSGFDQSEACWITRLLRALGITHAHSFSRRSTHLLCASAIGMKYEKAREWRIPIVDMEWLGRMVAEGRLMRIYALKHIWQTKGRPRPPRWVSNSFKILQIVMIDDLFLEDPTVPSVTNSDRSDLALPQKLARRGSHSSIFGAPNDILKSRSDPARPGSVFGRPNELLNLPGPSGPSANGSQLITAVAPGTPARNREAQRSSFNTPRRLHRSGSSSLQYVTRQNSLAASDHNSGAESNPESAHNTPSRKVDPEGQVRVPSSTTPSPMQIPRHPSRPPPSPARIPNEVTRALQESITSLLGKRQPSDDELVSGRVGKRARPHRSKPPSRQPSEAQISEPAPIPAPVFGSTSAFGVFVPDGGAGAGIDEQEESLRVMYEDPGQRDERKNL